MVMMKAIPVTWRVCGPQVRYVDYGTVSRVAAGALRALRREWCQLPAQAQRARLAGVRPAGGGRRWPHAAAAALLQLVNQKHLVAQLVAIDYEVHSLYIFCRHWPIGRSIL